MLADKISVFLEDRLEGYLELLKSWVEVNSHTVNQDGVNRHGRDVIRVFEQLGFSAKYVAPADSNHGNHIVLTAGPAEAPAIGLISHLDTVFSSEEEIRNGFSWRVEGDRIFGPGTLDIKGGTLAIYMLFDAMVSFLPELFNSIRWIILLNAAEEVAAEDFGPLCEAELGLDQSRSAGGKAAAAALVFESGSVEDDKFTLVTSRTGRFSGKIKITGKAAHAGISPQSGANAILQLAHTIQQLQNLNNLEAGLFINVGICSGGTETNIVPAAAELGFEIRSFDRALLARTVAQAEKIAGQSSVAAAADSSARCTQKLVPVQNLVPWPENSETTRLIEIWQIEAQRLGWQVCGQRRGGGSDGNAIAGKLPTIDGLGPAGGNHHCSRHAPDEGIEQEYVLVSSFVPKTVLNLLSIKKLTENS